MDLKEIGFEDVNWIHMGQEKVLWRALMDTVMNLQASLKAVVKSRRVQ
jgi:hypothetical protein